MTGRALSGLMVVRSVDETLACAPARCRRRCLTGPAGAKPPVAVQTRELPRGARLRRGRDVSEHGSSLQELERLAHLLDDRFRLPGTNLRFGLDGLLGLVPGVGDAVAGLIGLYLIRQARRHGAPGWLIARMLGNVGLDTLLGSVPLVGDLFDFAYKSNRRNVRLLLRHLERSRSDKARAGGA